MFNPHHLTLRQMAIYNRVARLLSFSGAARELHLTQPAVSLQVQRLEQTVGLPLFEQLGRKVYLTEAGRELLVHTEAVFRELHEAAELLAQLKDISKGTLSVSVASTAAGFSSRLLAAFMGEHPGATIRLDVTNRSTLLGQLAANERDLVIMGQPPPELDLEAEPIMANPLVLIAAADHPLGRQQPVSLVDLGRQPLVVREPGSGTRAAMERLFRDARLEPRIRVEIADSDAIKEAVAAGLGLSVIPACTLGADLAAGRLQVLQAEGFPIRRRWYLVYRRGKRFSPLGRAFSDYVIANAASMVEMPPTG